MYIDLNKTPISQNEIDQVKKKLSWEYYLMFSSWAFLTILIINDSFRHELYESLIGQTPLDERFMPTMALVMVGVFSLLAPTILVYEDMMYKRLLNPAPQDYYKKIKQALRMKEVRNYVEAVIAQGRGLTYLEIHRIQDYRANYKEPVTPISDFINPGK